MPISSVENVLQTNFAFATFGTIETKRSPQTRMGSRRFFHIAESAGATEPRHIAAQAHPSARNATVSGISGSRKEEKT